MGGTSIGPADGDVMLGSRVINSRLYSLVMVILTELGLILAVYGAIIGQTLTQPSLRVGLLIMVVLMILSYVVFNPSRSSKISTSFAFIFTTIAIGFFPEALISAATQGEFPTFMMWITTLVIIITLAEGVAYILTGLRTIGHLLVGTIAAASVITLMYGGHSFQNYLEGLVAIMVATYITWRWFEALKQSLTTQNAVNGALSIFWLR